MRSAISGQLLGLVGHLGGGLAACLAMTLQARAELRICNQTLDLYNVAVGYFTGQHCQPNDPLYPAACRLETEGWWNLPASSCLTLVKPPLDQRYYYVFALDIYGNDAITGNDPMCVNVGKRFSIQTPFDERRAPRCWQRGYQQVNFREIDAGGKPDWTVFVNPGGGG